MPFQFVKLTITAKIIGMTTKTAKIASAGTMKSQPAMAFWRSCCLMPVAMVTSQAREEQSPRLRRQIHFLQKQSIEGARSKVGERRKLANLGRLLGCYCLSESTWFPTVSASCRTWSVVARPAKAC